MTVPPALFRVPSQMALGPSAMSVTSTACVQPFLNLSLFFATPLISYILFPLFLPPDLSRSFFHFVHYCSFFSCKGSYIPRTSWYEKGLLLSYLELSSSFFYLVLYCVVGVVTAARCTATFSDLLCSPEFRYY